ncbi:MAG TPA: helix-turn-helix domain-containing protein [Steroidobacteraceae bacterium]|nr:helix-turn-helix domain-containing protein [Steroidobacteraceae bacterium]
MNEQERVLGYPLRRGAPDTELSCSRCALNRICLPAQLTPPEVRLLEGAVVRGRGLAAGARLVHAGSPMRALYVVRSGSAKACAITGNGDERVRGFFLPGEVVGLDAFADGRHLCQVVALEPLRYCMIPIRRLEKLMDALPSLRCEILRLLSRAIEEAQRLRLRAGFSGARERFADFLLDFSHRLERRGLSATQFRLSMSRGDIAQHLGLTIETVSRILHAFTREGWLEVHQRHIKLLNLQALIALRGA